ncbi:unnamed protein product [Adineta steineri]|uniref:G-protein coupled receptors family 1 profile domain-containing protein n=1 Tax=Adineta steineri TaxID=433720 RepID=A0A814YY67_9BILA|nr:unnamed protein product [Adineta steineri]
MSSAVAAATINTVAQWLNYVLAIPMITLGFIGAILTIIVFKQQKLFRRNPSIIYLLSGAIMTTIHLPTVYLQSILVEGFQLGLYNTNDIACRERNYLFYVTTVAAISYPCWAAFDQYASTHREAKFRHYWSSIKFARLAIIGTVIFWAIIYFPLIFVSSSINNVCIVRDGPYRIFHAYILTPIVFIMGPITLTTIFTLGTIRNLRSSAFSNRHDRLAKQIRRMLIPQLIILAIFGIPFGIDSVYQDITRNVQKDILRQAIEHLFAEITRVIYHVIFVSTFYIYLYMSNDVRKIMSRLVHRYIKKNDVVPFNISSGKAISMRIIRSTSVSNQYR